MAGKTKKAEPERIEVGEGAYLWRRPDSSRWHFYGYFNGVEIRRSTGTADVGKAKAKAREIVGAAEERQKHGRSVLSHRFSDLARRYLAEHVGEKDAWLRQGLSAADRAKRRNLKQRIEDYLIPFFDESDGGKPLDELPLDIWERYLPWREKRRREAVVKKREDIERRRADAEEKWKASTWLQRRYPDMDAYLPKRSLGHIREEVSAGAVNWETAILRMVLDYAVVEKLITKDDRPAAEYTALDEQPPKTLLTDGQWEKIRAKARERFRASRDKAVEVYLSRRGIGSELAGMALARFRATGEGWVGDREAWGRFELMCAIEILEATGMRPSTLTGIRQWQVSISQPKPPAPGNPDVPPSGPPPQNALDKLISAHTGPGHGLKDALLIMPWEVAPRYTLTGRTAKGTTRKKKKVRQWSIVPDPSCWPALRMLLARLGGDPQANLVSMRPGSINDGFKKILAAVGMSTGPDGEPISVYHLRHRYITRKLLAGTPIHIVAKNTMTSVQMIEVYYNHLQTDMAYDLIINGLPVPGNEAFVG